MLKEFIQMFLLRFKVKYRRKCLQLTSIIGFLIIIVFYFCEVNGKCSDLTTTCMNGGVCGNGTCVCPDGWQGDECQFCGGKVR